MKLLSNGEFFGVDGDDNDSGDGVDDFDEDFLNFPLTVTPILVELWRVKTFKLLQSLMSFQFLLGRIIPSTVTSIFTYQTCTTNENYIKPTIFIPLE